MGMSAFGVEDSRLSKADDSPPPMSAGRAATTVALPGWHGAVAGKKGKKLRAVGNEVGGMLGGSVVGGAVGRIVSRGNPAIGAAIGSQAGGMGGLLGGASHAQRKGYYKDQK